MNCNCVNHVIFISETHTWFPCKRKMMLVLKTKTVTVNVLLNWFDVHNFRCFI
jgi:hypothetical protein